MAHYMGIDVGTSSARACIIDTNGDIVGEGSQETATDPISRAEQSTTNIWQCICKAVKAAIDQNNISPDSIEGIGFDATCSLAVFNHETNEPISVSAPEYKSDWNVVLWLDHRPTTENVDISNALGPGLIKYFGGKMSPEFEICKVLWLKKHMPPELFDKCAFYDLADALVHIATGGEDSDFPSISRGDDFVPIGIDGSIKGWKEDFLKQINMGELAKDGYKRIGGVNKNGDYLSAGELAGRLCEKAASELGLRPGLPVGTGVIDSYAGWIGTVGAKVELDPRHRKTDMSSNDVRQSFTRLAAVAGTSTCHLIMSDKKVFVDRIWGPYRDVVVPGHWITEGGQSVSGELLRHVIETHPAFMEAEGLAREQKKNIFEFLDGHLAEMAKKQNAPFISYLARHFFFYGDIWGNRSPINDTRMTGSVVGLTRDISVDALAIHYYATLEFIALQTKQIVTQIQEAGHQVSSIFMSGSQCKNSILVKLIATACNMPVVIPKNIRAAVSYGSALLGAKAASVDEEGRTDDLWDIMDRMSKPGRAVYATENEKEKELLHQKYKIFLRQCAEQQAYRASIDALVDTWD